MNIAKDIEIVDLALYLNKYNTLIIADTHLGIEEAMNKQGLLVPRFQFKEVMTRFQKILDGLGVTQGKKLARIIVNGDFKHEFGRISETEWRHALQFIDLMRVYTDELILIKGNHDTILGPIAEKREVTLQKFILLGDILVTHGDTIFAQELKQCKTIIIGHEHPAVRIADDVRGETFKCYLKGTYKRKTLIVQPSFNLVSEGTNILHERLLSPYLHNLSSFDVYVVGEDVYHFGKVKELKNS